MLIWAEFPSGQRGLYGTNVPNMLNGVWAEVADGQQGGNSLVADPDPSIGSAGIVFRTVSQSVDSGPHSNFGRLALPAEVTTLGLGFRLWLSKLPTDPNSTPFIAFRTNLNTSILTFRISTTGQLIVASGGDFNGHGGTELFTSSPVLTANAYNHIEIKGTKGAGSGAAEIRVNGPVAVNLSGLTLSASNIAQFVIGSNDAGGDDASMIAYWKDIVIWDTTGSEVNNFQGSVAVYDLVTDGDNTLGDWNPSTGATGFPLLADNFPANTLTASGAISSGERVQIDTVYYQFTSGSVDAGTPAGTNANPWLVALGGDTATALQNLFKAIGATGVAGTTYSTALTAHATVNANGFTATAVSVTAKIVTASAIVTTETGANLAWVSGTLVLGPTDPSYIWADVADTTPYIATMTDLPPDVVTVRGVIPIGRMVKTDGGDCNIEMAVSPNGANWDAGANRAITIASTYWWDISTLSPATGVAWTPAEVNSMRFRVDRTA